MRVTNAATYRNFTTSVNNVHANLNKSLNKISSGEKYEAAADSPLSYYQGKKIDDQYLESLSKSTLLTDIKNRLYQQELGARDIQKILADGKNKVQEARTATSGEQSTLLTLQADLLQKQHEIIDDLNSQYENFYIYGGNDLSSTPFTLSADGINLTYNHTFSDGTSASIEFKLERKDDASYEYKVVQPTDQTEAQKLIIKAMSEQGRMDIGYGDIHSRETLLDTYTGGLNLLTGLSSDEVISMNKANPADAFKSIEERLNKSPLALIGQAVNAIEDYLKDDVPTTSDDLHRVLGQTIEDMTVTEHTISSIYSDLGNKYKLLEDTDTKLKREQDSLTEQYKDILGADPYASILEMYNNNYAYNAALRVGSNLMNTSLFDFMR